MIRITVNDQQEELPAGTTVAQLLEQLRMRARFVAVERNASLVPRAQHAACVLEAGDQLEIVTLVGGG
jgi:thiamine biosynthesis protein ThiS